MQQHPVWKVGAEPSAVVMRQQTPAQPAASGLRRPLQQATKAASILLQMVHHRRPWRGVPPQQLELRHRLLHRWRAALVPQVPCWVPGPSRDIVALPPTALSWSV